jgi:hypothetical protein
MAIFQCCGCYCDSWNIADRFPLNVMDVSIVFFQIVYVGTATIIVAKRGGSRFKAESL